jgi:hypothetical protein
MASLAPSPPRQCVEGENLPNYCQALPSVQLWTGGDYCAPVLDLLVFTVGVAFFDLFVSAPSRHQGLSS